MTTTNYSRELCEICRIKPEIIEDYDGNEFEIYPDFTHPENFVKLLNFYYRFFQGVDVYADDNEVRELEAKGEQISIQEDFLANLIFNLQNRESPFTLDIDFTTFTQGIREQEWSYE